jgi:hypothetical protein
VSLDADVKHGWVARRRNTLWLLAISMFVGLVAIGAVSFEGEGRASGVSGDPNLAEGVRIHANLEKMVPGDPQLMVRLDFEPRGRFAQNGVFLAQRLRVIAVGGAGLVDESFASGGVMTPTTLPVALEGGDASQYPFDGYTALFGVRVLTSDGAPAPRCWSPTGPCTATPSILPAPQRNPTAATTWRSACHARPRR